jgi:uncharacterized membrane protein HdeD (DUF308 family)
MSQIPSAGVPLSEHELRHLKREWWWFLLLGILLVLGGLLSLIYPAITTLAAVVVLGMSLLVCGASTIALSFWTGRWNAFLLQLLVGLMYVVVGFIVLDSPLGAEAGLTLFVAAMFIVVGILRSVAALVLRFPQWGWALLSGMITALLGIMILQHLGPFALVAIGILVGVELLFAGWYWIMLGIAVSRLPV